MIIPYKPCIVADDKIFSVEKIHKKYWKEFCNVCYPLFDFENKDDGERTYEQRYETFCRCHNMATEYFRWNEKNMFLVNEQDFVRLRNAYELLIHLSSNDKAPILMLLVFLRMQQSIWNRPRICGKRFFTKRPSRPRIRGQENSQRGRNRNLLCERTHYRIQPPR